MPLNSGRAFRLEMLVQASAGVPPMGVCFVISLFFVYRSFYGMRIGSGSH